MKVVTQLLLAALLAAGAWAQAPDLDVLVDEDYRVYDLVYLTSNKKPVECTVLPSDDPDLVKIQRKGRSGSVSIERSQVKQIVPRQTPISAYRERAELLQAAARGDLHRRLAEWCLKQSLQVQAEEQLVQAAKAESDPAEGNRHRERLVGLLEQRAWGQVPTAPELLEQILQL
ncbi:MAG: hypothetical protein KDD82_21435, partial [Planctomycetes bacterium]|nr:hypothetical protein [Planctomycetota bacterium]